MSKCSIVGGLLNTCKTLSDSIEGLANSKGKGIKLFAFTDLKTNKLSRSFAVARSGDFVKEGIVMRFCPFCGETIFEERESCN